MKMRAVIGALTGATGALIAIGFLGALSFVLFVAALQAVVGLPGTALAAVAFIFVGNGISGGSVPVAFLPGGFRQIAPWLPNNAIVRATRDVVYFHGHDLAHPLLVLGLWPAVALSVIAAVDLLHLSERRRRTTRTRSTAPPQSSTSAAAFAPRARSRATGVSRGEGDKLHGTEKPH
jgi:ABC-type multidrug transport system permease subunit